MSRSTTPPAARKLATTSPSKRRRNLPVSLLFLLPLVALFYLTQSPSLTRHLPSPRPLSPEQPLPLPPLLTIPRNTKHAAHLASLPFATPLLQTHYARPHPTDPALAQLYVLTAGLRMGSSQRNFSAAGCLIGNHVYPAIVFIDELVLCHPPSHLSSPSELSVVLHHDDTLRTALRAPVTLPTGIVAELKDGDIRELPGDVTLHGNLSKVSPGSLRAIRSYERYEGLSESYNTTRTAEMARYAICHMTLVSPGAEMLPDWVDYHRRLGVDHVYIFDNGADIDLPAIFANRKDVTVTYWPFHKSQLQAFSFFLLASRARCERVMFSDVDEYVMLGLGKTPFEDFARPLRTYARLVEKKGFRSFTFPTIYMRNSGFLRRPTGHVPELYVHRNHPQSFRLGKSVCATDEDYVSARVHGCGCLAGGAPLRRYGSYPEADLEERMEPTEVEDAAFVVHYYERSWEEWLTKVKMGSPSLLGKARAGSGKMREFSLENPNKNYLKTDVNHARKYTHFRGVWRRVTKEGSLDEFSVVKVRDGLRCESILRGSDGAVGRVREECVYSER